MYLSRKPYRTSFLFSSSVLGKRDLYLVNIDREGINRIGRIKNNAILGFMAKIVQ